MLGCSSPLRRGFWKGAIRAPGGVGSMVIQIVVEDGLKEIIESAGAMAAIENAVHRKILDLKNDYWDKQSRQSVLSRGYQGTQKT
jgi:hypothetical protein